MLYRNFSRYMRERYGVPVGKRCIDGGFTCPNRDGSCGTGGCIFCGEHRETAPSDCTAFIKDQVRRFPPHTLNGKRYIIYFQNFTNTYAPIEELRRRYDAALTDDRIAALAIATRPDCITEETAELLRSYTDRYDVWVELGLQTANDDTARFINRGYERKVFEKAAEILRKWKIPAVVHLMIGLPGENQDDIAATVQYINRFSLCGIKIHSVYVARNTPLADMYFKGEYTPITMEQYIESAIYVLTHISPEMTIHRLTGSCSEELLIAPEWCSNKKNDVIGKLTKLMNERGWTQGCFYETE